jgi:hypothetical protein
MHEITHPDAMAGATADLGKGVTSMSRKFLMLVVPAMLALAACDSKEATLAKCRMDAETHNLRFASDYVTNCMIAAGYSVDINALKQARSEADAYAPATLTTALAEILGFL